MKLAIFGGTFDPVHDAHLVAAREAADLCELSRVLFVTAGRPPHKSRGPYASYADRLRMVEIACEIDPRFEASRLEEGPEISYSIGTIERVRAGIGADAGLYFLIGADAFAEIETWRRWREVVDGVEFIVVSRPGANYHVPAGARVVRLEHVELPVSSSEIRAQIAGGDAGVQIPPRVAAYIEEHGLYR